MTSHLPPYVDASLAFVSCSHYLVDFDIGRNRPEIKIMLNHFHETHLSITIPKPSVEEHKLIVATFLTKLRSFSKFCSFYRWLEERKYFSLKK